MVVQHILSSRIGRREVKPVVPKVEVSEKSGSADKEDSVDDENASDNPVKKEDAETEEKEIKSEDAIEDEKKSETDSPKKDHAKKQEESTDSKATETAVVEAKPQFIEVEEYYVKYRNFSYLHCEWKTEEELYKGDKRIQAKLKRFKQKQQQNTNIFENVLNVYYFKILIYSDNDMTQCIKSLKISIVYVKLFIVFYVYYIIYF